MRWSVRVQDLDGTVLIDEGADRVLRTASIGKLLLLAEVARAVAAGELDAGERLTRTAADAVADSGVWQHLSVDTLSISDLCVLIGTASDNLATNVLLRRISLEAVGATADALGLRHTALLDQVRDVRTAAHPWTLSTGSAAELTGLMSRLGHRDLFDGRVSGLMAGWLSHGLDLSMVAAPWGLDPLAHAVVDRGLSLVHKTGTDDGVRGDVGVLTGPSGAVAYAVLANWNPHGDTDGSDHRDAVLARMREIGRLVRDRVDQR